MTSVYAQRRARLAAQLGAGGIAIIPTAPERGRNRDNSYLYRHDSYFYYLTGFTEPQATLVLAFLAMAVVLVAAIRYGPAMGGIGYGRDGGYAQIRLSSGELRLVRQECMATIGAVSNADHSNQNLGKAGRNRHLGIRPSVRGVAMNPIDHPHGGGEGRTSGGRHPVTPWGKGTKGNKTRTNKATDKYILRSRNAKKGR